MFKVPEALGSSPVTPESNKKKSINFFSPPQHSTTPAGPPPSSLTNPSTTPAGPPPTHSSIFDNNHFQSSIPAQPSFGRDGFHRSPLRQSNSFRDGYYNEEMEEDYDINMNSSVPILGDKIDDDEIPSNLNYAVIAKGLASRAAALHESGDVIIGTEHSMRRFQTRLSESDKPNWDVELSTLSQELLHVWKNEIDGNIESEGVGPGEAASAVSKSVFLSSLLLSFHHPPQRFGRTQPSEPLPQRSRKPIPEVLIDWLEEYHNPYPNDFEDVAKTPNGPAANDRFWDVIFQSVLRGKVGDAIELLRNADFSVAQTAEEDGAAGYGYQGNQLGNVQKVVQRAIALLESCPAVQAGDWDVKNSQWNAFRKRVIQAMSDLQTFAEGTSLGRDTREERSIRAEKFGVSTGSDEALSMSRMSQRARSRVPWTIYQSLSGLYGQLLGQGRDILAASADWVEASVGMTIWWDGDDPSPLHAASLSGRKSLTGSRNIRPIDLNPQSAYWERLKLSFRLITSEADEAELQVSTSDVVEVGLACIIEGDLPALIKILQGWSETISTAVVEVASFGSWLNNTPMSTAVNGLDQSDLMVLSYAQQSKDTINKDHILMSYADLVAKESTLYSKKVKSGVKGWELAVQILARVDNIEVANNHIATLLDTVDLKTNEQIEKIMVLCDELDLTELGRRMAEKYANHLSSTSDRYGGALFYYARAHRLQKVKEVLNVLISSCLVHSTAFPPKRKLDKTLAAILASPVDIMNHLGVVDRKAAELISKHVSGYATLRRFYDLRDEEVNLKPGQRSTHRPAARNREAASALIATIMSAADSIHGGLLDTTVDSIVPVDCLLTLLGEALMFINQDTRILQRAQIFALLKAVEDVSTVSSWVFEQSEECLKAALAAAHGGQSVPSSELMKKSTSSLSGSTFSLLNSVMMESAEASSSGKGSTMVKSTDTIKRAWDWRQGLKKGARGTDLLKILRLGLANEVSRVWMEGAGEE